MARERASPGVSTVVCRFPAKVESRTEGTPRCSIVSDGRHVRESATALELWEVMEAIGMPYSENKVRIAGGRMLKHSACPLPMAVLRGFEASAGPALERDVAVIFDQ
jgi:hypothetical protein